MDPGPRFADLALDEGLEIIAAIRLARKPRIGIGIDCRDGSPAYKSVVLASIGVLKVATLLHFVGGTLELIILRTFSADCAYLDRNLSSGADWAGGKGGNRLTFRGSNC